MGEKPTEDTDIGDDFLTCFEAGETPLYILASFSGIEDCDPDIWPEKGGINGRIWMTQSEVNPGLWQGGRGDFWGCAYLMCDNGSSKLLLGYRGTSYFEGIQATCCETNFVNSGGCAVPLKNGVDGGGAVMWVPVTDSPSIQKLMNKLNMEITHETLYEFWYKSLTRTVVRFARIKDATNVYVEIDPDVL